MFFYLFGNSSIARASVSAYYAVGFQHCTHSATKHASVYGTYTTDRQSAVFCSWLHVWSAYSMILVMVFVPAQFANDKIIVYNYLRESGWLRPLPVRSTERAQGVNDIRPWATIVRRPIRARPCALVHSSRTASMEAEISAYLRSSVDPARWTGQA